MPDFLRSSVRYHRTVVVHSEKIKHEIKAYICIQVDTLDYVLDRKNS